jgi:hypothetical protein
MMSVNNAKAAVDHLEEVAARRDGRRDAKELDLQGIQ